MPRSHNSALPQHYGSLMPTVRDHDHNVHSHQSHRPSEEGWRTPTIEDADHPHNLSSSNNGNAAVALTDRLHQLQHRRRPLFHQGHERSKSCDSQSIPTMRLSWKDRIKHVTWAYFTLCMATGGIANVLSAGMLAEQPATQHTEQAQCHIDSEALRPSARYSCYSTSSSS